MASNGFAGTFREEAHELLANLESLLLDLEKSPRDRDLIDQVFRTMHTIKGSGSMFGFDDVVAVVHEIETVFDLVRAGRLEVSADLINRTLQARDQIRLLIDPERSGEAPNMALIGQLIEEFRAFAGQQPPQKTPLSATTPASPTHPAPESPDGSPARRQELAVEFLAGSVPEDRSTQGQKPPQVFSQPPSIEESLSRLPGNGPSVAPPEVGPPDQSAEPKSSLATPSSEPAIWSIRFAPGPELFMTGNNPVGILKELAGLGECEIRPDLRSLPALESLAPESCHLAWDILLRTTVDLNGIRDVFLFVEDHARVEITPTDAAFQENTEFRNSRNSPRNSPEAAAAPRRQAEGRRDLRISAEKLDRLVELIGELVTVQARLSQVAAQRSDAELTSLAEELDRLSGDLRDSALKIRMLPIGATFEALRERIDETARHHHKDLRVVIHGTDTELDKDVIERLSAPLGQLVRLAVVHSLEPRATRQSRGKPERATLSLTAKHFGGNLCIEVRDDGQGFDPAALRARAKELGLASPGEDPTGQELLRLLCQPGFFAEGGLGVVKAVIDDLRGTLEIENRPGLGLAFSLRLPLTLAIIEGLVVALGTWHFVLPLAAVEECIELTRQEEARTYRKNVVMVRDQIVPYIPLREKFAVDGTPPAIQQIVIASVGQHRVGFVVDQVIGEFQTVIKPLGNFYKNVKGISGATILGDGSVALIVDLTKIVQEENHLLDPAQQGG